MAVTILCISCPACGKSYVPAYPVTVTERGIGKCMCIRCFHVWALQPKQFGSIDEIKAEEWCS